jgi:SAM-dependent methyltransferase
MARVDRYNDWVAKALRPYRGQRILEVGCGIGNMTPYLLDAERVTCIDVLPESVAHARQQFAHLPHVTTMLADISRDGALAQVGEACYDTAVCINVLEHIEDDAAALRGMLAALQPGGHLLLFVPAGEYLFGALDTALGHYRRYELRSLGELVAAQGFEIRDLYYMNVAGIPGWFLSSRVLRRTTPPEGLLWLFNLLTPAFARIEARWRPPVGQSLVCIARRPIA